jgi:AmmeMemoRadiSam system protein A
MEATHCTRLEPASRELLLQFAAAAIESGLFPSGKLPPDARDLPVDLLREQASFVTLTIDGRLRGCCGALEPRQMLATDVWHNARASAFRDPRFAPLMPREWQQTDLEVAVLSPLERLPAQTEQALLGELRPGVDGLLIAWRGERATFLPKVWQTLADPTEFLRHLKNKAGWRDDFWAPDLEAWRYVTDTMAVQRPAAGPSTGTPLGESSRR